jgi:pimeloyl-ACP methyl ester carboxylesterase
MDTEVTKRPAGRGHTKIGALVGDDTGQDRSRPPIVLLHGLTFDRRTWRPVVDAFRELDPERRVINLDLPGHGESPAHPPHDLPLVAELIHDALLDVGADRPLMVGHSMSGALVSLYASTYPAAGVVNVDQPPLIAPFAELVKSIEPQLRGPAFADVWSMFFRSFNTELLPPAARQLVEATCNPRQDVVLGYWAMILERPVEEITAMIEESVQRLERGRVPYVLVAGHQLPDPVTQWMQERLPHADITVWDGSGHFPHLAHPDRFALVRNSPADWSFRGN